MHVAIALPVGDQAMERMLGARAVGRPVSAKMMGLIGLKVEAKRSLRRGREVLGGAIGRGGDGTMSNGLVVVFGGGCSSRRRVLDECAPIRMRRFKVGLSPSLSTVPPNIWWYREVDCKPQDLDVFAHSGG